jgi:hypothetical protein
MTEVEQLKHRLATIADDLQSLRKFIAQEGLTETFYKPTEHCDEAVTHLNNIEIACDLSSEESLAWGLFNK